MEILNIELKNVSERDEDNGFYRFYNSTEAKRGSVLGVKAKQITFYGELPLLGEEITELQYRVTERVATSNRIKTIELIFDNIKEKVREILTCSIVYAEVADEETGDISTYKRLTAETLREEDLT